MPRHPCLWFYPFRGKAVRRHRGGWARRFGQEGHGAVAAALRCAAGCRELPPEPLHTRVHARRRPRVRGDDRQQDHGPRPEALPGQPQAPEGPQALAAAGTEPPLPVGGTDVKGLRHIAHIHSTYWFTVDICIFHLLNPMDMAFNLMSKVITGSSDHASSRLGIISSQKKRRKKDQNNRLAAARYDPARAKVRSANNAGTACQ